MGRPEDRVNAETLGVSPKHITLTTAAPTYQMKRGDHVLSVISSAADAAGIVTLPSLAEACGGFYFVSAPTGLSGGDVSLYEKETGAEFSTYGALDADADHVLLFAGPISWILIFDGVA